MRYDTKFNYDYLIQKIQDKYQQSTLNKNIIEFCKEVYYFTPYHFKQVVINNFGYFNTREILKMSKALDLSDDDIIKCFFKEDKEDGK